VIARRRVAWRGVAGAAASLILSAGLLGAGTRGFTALTTDGARALDIAEHPRVVPDPALLDARGRPLRIADPDRVTIVDFVYSRCPSLCGALGGVYQRLQSEIRRRGLGGRVRLLTVSFDPAWDTPERLRYYETMLRPDRAIWTVATLRDATALDPLLAAFGVRLIADGAGGFEHNAALHVVDTSGRLVAVVPIAASSLDTRGATGGRANDAFDEAIGSALDEAIRASGGAR
jgi:protein SCO1/2